MSVLADSCVKLMFRSVVNQTYVSLLYFKVVVFAMFRAFVKVTPNCKQVPNVKINNKVPVKLVFLNV